MRAELKPGGLALIVESSIPDNLGRTVELVAHLGNGDPLDCEGVIYNNPDHIQTWHIRSCSSGPLLDGDGDPHDEMPFGEKALMPIGPGDPDEVRHQEKSKDLIAS